MWGNANDWVYSSPTMSFYSSISGSSTATIYDSSIATVKRKSIALNVDNMKGIDLRKAIKSKTVKACELLL